MSPRTLDPIDVEIGAIVRGLRESIGLSQAALADRVGILRPAVTLIEAGKQRLPMCHVEPFARALCVRGVDLLPARWRA